MLKASAGIGAALVVSACGNSDPQVFAGAVTDAAPQPVVNTPTSIPTTAPLTPEPFATDAVPPETNEAQPAPEPTEAPSTTAAIEAAIVGELVVSFTYTQGIGGKNERPYIAVWIENEAGELLETVSLWYEQGRRGARWLDHLDRWWAVDQSRIAGGGVDDSVVISSATRQAGSHAVAWDGTIDGTVAAAGRYFVCVEAAREEGPLSLVRETFDLVGSSFEAALPDSGELSAVTVRTSV